MTVQTFYRLAVWLPLAIPCLAALFVHGLRVGPTGTAFDEVMTLLLASLLYGVVPYAPIALWATFWIDSRTEKEIRRRAVRSPFWMIVSFAAFSAYLAIVSGKLVMAMAVFVFGAIVSIGLGYLYVVIVFSLRDSWFGPYEPIGPDTKWRW